MTIRLSLAAICAASTLLACLAAPSASAGDVRITDGVQGAVRAGVVSYREIPFKTVVRQQYDFSCGSAALATLLTYHFNRPTSEKDAFLAMYEIGDQEKINREGFSLFEMKQYLESLGYRADGFRVGLDKVQRVGVPVIVLMEWKGYKHFVVIKGIRDGHVLIGDPARGLRIMPIDEFEGYWIDGIVFAIHNAELVGREHFNVETEWKGRPKSPLGTAISRSGLNSFNILLPGAAELF